MQLTISISSKNIDDDDFTYLQFVRDRDRFTVQERMVSQFCAIFSFDMIRVSTEY